MVPMGKHLIKTPVLAAKCEQELGKKQDGITITLNKEKSFTLIFFIIS